jgi:LacI family transcriptional regulator
LRVFLVDLRHAETNASLMVRRIVLVASDTFVRRLTPALAAFVPMRLDFRIVEIYRPPRELLARIRELNPAGIITESLPELTEVILKLHLPTVVVDSDLTHPGAVSVDVDDHAVGAQAARFFQQGGYGNFACVHNATPYSEQRLEGFRAALGDGIASFHAFRQIERRARHYMESWNAPTERLRAWLMRLPKPVAIFAVHDPLGRLVAEASSEAGLQVPDELAIMGANNDDLVCGLSYPPLSSVEIAWDRIGALAGKWVIDLMEGRRAPASPLLVQPGPVCVRQSTALVAVEDPDVRRVVQYLRDHHRDSLTIDGVCRTLHLSRRTVERKFAMHLRTTPWDSLCRMRVDTARSLLVRSDDAISNIATGCGFSDPERFSVVFRRHVGQSPSAFRKEIVRGVPFPQRIRDRPTAS